MDEYVLPRIPASAGALLRDGDGRVLILRPTYKSGWTVPGGQIEEDGESPWEGCRREVAEETGLDVTSGRLACVDFLHPKPGRPGGIRFLFDCGVVDAGRRDVMLSGMLTELQAGYEESIRAAIAECGLLLLLCDNFVFTS